jgi:hypothetical protein
MVSIYLSISLGQIHTLPICEFSPNLVTLNSSLPACLYIFNSLMHYVSTDNRIAIFVQNICTYVIRTYIINIGRLHRLYYSLTYFANFLRIQFFREPNFRGFFRRKITGKMLRKFSRWKCWGKLVFSSEKVLKNNFPEENSTESDFSGKKCS